MCGPLQLACDLGGATTGTVGNSAVENLARSVAEGVVNALTGVATAWVEIPTPSLTASAGSSEASEVVAFLQGGVWWYALGIAVLGLVIAGIRMAWDQRGEHLMNVVRGLLILVIATGAGLMGIAILTTAADEFSAWILARSMQDQGGTIAENLTLLVQPIIEWTSSGSTSGVGLPALSVIVVGLVLLLIAVVQVVLMIARGGMLVLLAGVLPVVAGAATMETGRVWLQRYLAWTLAFILYKPVAALVYATAFSLMGQPALMDGGLIQVLTGTMLLAMAVVALPALMRFITPAVGALAGANPFGAASGLAAGAGALPLSMPTGAKPTGASAATPAVTSVASGARSDGSGDGQDRSATGAGTPGGNGSSGQGRTAAPVGAKGDSGARGESSSGAAGKDRVGGGAAAAARAGPAATAGAGGAQTTGADGQAGTGADNNRAGRADEGEDG